ncbi:Interferon- developmental regulator 1 [Basidiobolus ranarum]|uniref:Interferon- developmental regulator 1 n=1 Tax=Basidiobolus ranarum TaxID=34480 RepID=A0ABR2W2K9_9FUNG
MTHISPKNLLKKAVKSASKASSRTATPASSRHASDLEEDGLSEGSDSTLDSLSSFQDDMGNVDWSDELKKNIEELSEKRTTARESTLLRLAKILSHKYLDEDLYLQRDTIMDTLKKCIKRSGSVQERILAAKVIVLCFITLGAGEESLYKDVSPILKSIVHDTTEPDVLSAVINCLAVISFVASTDELETLKLMDMFTVIFKDSHRSPQTIVSAVNAHGLLFTTLGGSSRITRSIFDSTMPILTRLLESSNVEIRVSSGESMALMIEILRDNCDSPFRYDRMKTLIASLNSLATDCSKHRSKKDRSAQRSAFREIIGSIDDEQSPELKLKFRGEVITFTGWSEIKQLNAFREALTEGLHVHFQYNDLLHDIFEVSFTPDMENDSQYSSNYVISPSSELSKLRSQDMAKQRQRRGNREGLNDYY